MALAHRLPRRSIALLGLICLLDGIDSGLISSSIRAMEASLGLSIVALSRFEIVAGLSAALAGPFWAVAADAQIVSVKRMLVGGVAVWGGGTALIGCVPAYSALTVPLLVVLRAAVWAAMACIMPLLQVLVAEYAQPEQRGRCFAAIGFSMSSGHILSSLVGTAVSNVPVDLGGSEVRGWRLAFLGSGAASLLLALLVHCVLADLPREGTPPTQAELTEAGGVLPLLRIRAKGFMQILKIRQAPKNRFVAFGPVVETKSAGPQDLPVHRRAGLLRMDRRQDPDLLHPVLPSRWAVGLGGRHRGGGVHSRRPGRHHRRRLCRALHISSLPG